MNYLNEFMGLSITYKLCILFITLFVIIFIYCLINRVDLLDIQNSKLESFSTAANIRKDSSTRVKYGENGTVSKVILTESNAGNPLINVEVRDTRPIGIGDKVSSRHGQKGIIGYVAKPQDMPFTSSGTVPDVLFNPFGMRRMTVSHIMEALGAKVGSLNGRYIDGTPFSGEKIEDLSKNKIENQALEAKNKL